MRFQGLAYRAHHPRWAFAPDSGEGVARHGWRFNPPGMPALYTSLRLETAWLEAQQAFPFKARPMTICAYAVDCEDILDLTDARVLAGIGARAADLANPWEDIVDRGGRPVSWALAERLIAAGHAGIIVPSFAAGAREADRSLVFWKWADALPHQVRVVDDHARLPKGDLSWQ